LKFVIGRTLTILSWDNPVTAIFRVKKQTAPQPRQVIAQRFCSLSVCQCDKFQFLEQFEKQGFFGGSYDIKVRIYRISVAYIIRQLRVAMKKICSVL